MSDFYKNFKAGKWLETIDVQDFIELNYTPYEGDDSFLADPTENTKKLWNEVLELMKIEREKGVLDVDTHTPSGITAHGPGYIDQALEKVVGLQTDAPLKRAIMPFGGIRMVEASCESYGYELDPQVTDIFTKYRKTHNQGVFDLYTSEMRAARKTGVITGLPDAYGRGRIIGDHRRVALYGVDRLIAAKEADIKVLAKQGFSEETFRLREEVKEQINALKEMKAMAASYGFDISRPAESGIEATQWLYFAYLAAIKEQNGAAMSIGRNTTFLDIYLSKDIEEGKLTEEEAQEIIDHFVMKLRMVRFLRTPEYNDLFSGDPVWVTESIGGLSSQGKHLVTKTAYRMLHTLYNLGPSPEPNLTVLWSKDLPENFKKFCAKVSIDTSSIQYESDDLMRETCGNDYAIACCVSPLEQGKQIQFFGARANLAKALLYSINGGVDEVKGIQVGPTTEKIADDVLEYDKVWTAYQGFMSWLAGLYVHTLNIIHYMHDKYAYEKAQMSLLDTVVSRNMAAGIAGLSVVADSLSAIKYAKVKPIRNEQGITVDFDVEGDFPKYGNNDERVDNIAQEVVTYFMNELRKHKTYRDATHSQSVLTITSNVVYGKKTGNTPDGRRAGEPFAPGANPMHGRDTKGAVASLASVAKIPFEDCADGISYTFSIIPKALGKTVEDRTSNLVGLLDGYFAQTGQHLNVNVFDREMLLDAMEHPENYPQLTIRVSGYAVNFIKLTREQQLDVINRTFHQSF